MATRHSRERDLLRAAEHPVEGETCPECEGDGYERDYFDSDPSWSCRRCKGLGYIVPDGDALADDAGDRMYDERTGA